MRPSCGGSRIVFVARSGEAERLALLRPAERQSGVGDQLLRREAAWLPALEDGARDIGSEKRQAQQQCHIGWAELFPHRQIGDASAGAAAKLLLQAMRANQQFDGLMAASMTRRLPWPIRH